MAVLLPSQTVVWSDQPMPLLLAITQALIAAPAKELVHRYLATYGIIPGTRIHDEITWQVPKLTEAQVAIIIAELQVLFPATPVSSFAF